MNILSMLARLEGALGRDDLTEQMILLPQAQSIVSRSSKDVNFVVGYNGSPRSQTALDLTLWIAHQTRLATHKQVTVQVVYVVNLNDECNLSSLDRPVFANDISDRTAPRQARAGAQPAKRKSSKSTAVKLPDSTTSLNQICQVQQFDEADRILWQARNLAEEWRGSLKTHLRFGQVAAEIQSVVQAESASLLLLGCESVEHPLVKQLGSQFPCPVLGIPAALCACS